MTDHRPGPPLHEDECLAAILGDAADKLAPYPDLAEICDSVRFVRKRLLWRLPEGLAHGQEVGK